MRILLLLALTLGCYRSHALEGEPGPRPDAATPRDTGAVPDDDAAEPLPFALRLVDYLDQPVEGAEATLVLGGAPQRRVSDARGEVVFELRAGERADLYVQPPGEAAGAAAMLTAFIGYSRSELQAASDGGRLYVVADQPGGREVRGPVELGEEPPPDVLTIVDGAAGASSPGVDPDGFHWRAFAGDSPRSALAIASRVRTRSEDRFEFEHRALELEVPARPTPDVPDAIVTTGVGLDLREATPPERVIELRLRGLEEGLDQLSLFSFTGWPHLVRARSFAREPGGIVRAELALFRSERFDGTANLSVGDLTRRVDLDAGELTWDPTPLAETLVLPRRRIARGDRLEARGLRGATRVTFVVTGRRFEPSYLHFHALVVLRLQADGSTVPMPGELLERLRARALPGTDIQLEVSLCDGTRTGGALGRCVARQTYFEVQAGGEEGVSVGELGFALD
ncbi:MAG TPA: hypothetical protein RMH85_29770 [Polyangiaceae bacterium LLY-WYZ-15_(1-7)]|nr:hypothetical protein [Sandaracinus sp.]HJL03648.1 hypothetical protein [Polyangiaceae bacterium LLY-WYZ-15_(1-7)]MBJ71491.1 hypothetical protein [Sandaracinus sp.]HJL12707.1 hypothetical protein [Polyangiaceae bacterium LLY-WYZ-15_(1-7)]HJL24591.1 hypothetical protein [Polyangiaceae bacterium LLY-WYZ-15_(1-7)]